MSGIFSRPKTPTPPPTVDTAAVDRAGEAERLRSRKAAGRASTMLTGGKITDAKTGTTQLLGS